MVANLCLARDVTDQHIHVQHHYAKGSAQREGLLSAVQAMKSKGAVEVPIVVGGKQVSTTVTIYDR